MWLSWTLALAGLAASQPTGQDHAASLADPASSSICNKGTGTPELCVALNIPTEPDASNDLFFKVTGSAKTAYTGIGFGKVMAGSLMILVFPQPGGTVTASMRLATGRSRPALAPPTTTIEVLDGSAADGTKFTANLRCKNCRTWTGGAFAASNVQEFIYAYGSATGTEVGDKGITTYHGPLSRGYFQLGIAQATGPGGVPTSSGTPVRSVTDHIKRAIDYLGFA